MPTITKSEVLGNVERNANQFRSIKNNGKYEIVLGIRRWWWVGVGIWEATECLVKLQETITIYNEQSSCGQGDTATNGATLQSHTLHRPQASGSEYHTTQTHMRLSWR